MWLLSDAGELYGIEYFKLVFLKYLNVPTWSIFAGLVTYVLWIHLTFWYILFCSDFYENIENTKDLCIAYMEAEKKFNM